MARFHNTTLCPQIWGLPATGFSNSGNDSSRSEPGTPTSHESDDLVQLREVETLAKNVYLTLYTKWGNEIFEMKSVSVQKHTDKVEGLFDGFATADLVSEDCVAVFVNTERTPLKRDLVVNRMQCKADALWVGTTIEYLDIFDLSEMQDTPRMRGILDGNNMLESGSDSFPRSLASQLAALNAAYAPQIRTIVAIEQNSSGGHI